jgi:hypothetical protein
MGHGSLNFGTKLVLVTFSLAALGVVTISKVRSKNFYARQPESTVGTIRDITGEVQIRSEDGVFRRVESGHPVSDGDQIVTANESKAVVDLKAGRSIICSANSRITVTSLEDDRNTPTILIDATRSGETEASTVDNSARPVILLTGKGAITVNAGESITTKNSGSAEGSEIIRTDKKTGIQTALVKVDDNERNRRIQEALAAAASPTPTPTPIATPKTVAPRPDSPPVLLTPAPGSVLWSAQDLQKIENDSIGVVISFKGPAPGTGLTLEVKEDGNSASRGVQEKLVPSTESGKYSARFSVASIQGISRGNITGGKLRRDFSLAVLSGDGTSARRIPVAGKFGVGSLSPLVRDTGVILGLTSIAESPAPGPWITGRFEDDPGRLPLVIRLFKPGMFTAFVPAIRSAKLLAVKNGATMALTGTFVVKGQEIVAQIAGPIVNNELTDKVRALIDGDFVFTGPQEALVSAKKYSIDEIQKMIAGSVQSGKSIFVFQDQSLFEVNAEFVRKYPSVASFVRRNSNAFFTKEVKINSFR